MKRLGYKARGWRISILGITLLGTVLSGCKDPENTDFQGRLVVKLVDAPATLESLEVVFSRVEIHRKGASADVGWRVVSENIVAYDLLTLRNGVSRDLVSTIVPEGIYDRIKVLFEISELRDASGLATVFIPDELRNGAEFEYEFEVREGQVTGITFDFDAARSVRVNTLGRYELHPIVRIQNTDLAGSIIGGIVPDSVETIIATALPGDSVTTRSLAQSGNNSFELVDLPEGVYTVVLSPTDPAYRDTSVTGVVVVRRQKTNIGAIVLPR